MPTTRPEFWAAKFEANRRRDERVRIALANDGWRVEVVWECETRDKEKLTERLISFLGLATPGRCGQPRHVGAVGGSRPLTRRRQDLLSDAC